MNSIKKNIDFYSNLVRKHGIRKVGKGKRSTSKKGFVIFSYRKSGKFVIPHNKLSFDNEEAIAVLKVIKSGRWCVGDTVKKVEEELCKLTGRKHCILVGSGIAALRLSLLALGVQENDFVALPAYSCVALANAALSLGANTIPLDIEKESLNLQSASLTTIEPSDAKVAVCVHTFGNPCKIAKTARLKTIEDCSHGLLRSRMGSLADLAVISFYATKFIAGGMGGAILTDDESVAERVLDYRDYDDKPSMRWRLNDKISDIHAALVKVQLSKIKFLIAQREQAALRYFELFEPLMKILEDMGLELPNFSSERVWYRFPIRLKNKDINYFIEKMSGFKINVARPITCWVKNPEQFPQANSAFKEIVSLPFFPTITYEEQQYVCRKTLEVLNSYE